MPREPGVSQAGVWSLLRSARGLFWLTATAALGAWLCFVPLFNLLGYAFCLALAAVGSLGAAHLGASLVATSRDDAALLLATRTPARALALLLGRAALAGLALLVVPLLLISLNALRVRNCDPLTGTGFVLLMPATGALFAAATGVLAGALVPRPRLASACAMGVVLLFWAWAAWRVYDGPAIFAFDPFVGYFPGVLYDEDVAVRGALLAYRGHNLLWLAAAIASAAAFFDPSAVRLRLAAWRGNRRALVAAALALAGGATTFVAGAAIGFDSNFQHIASELGGVRHTPHFDIYHPRRLSPAEVDLLAEDHEFRYQQLRRVLGAEPGGRIRSLVFESAGQKRRLMGAGRTLVAKPWRREVYLQHRRFPHPVLKHELAHVFAGAFGDRLLGVSVGWARLGGLVPAPRINFGLIEGLAVAADWRAQNESTVHEQTAALARLGLAPPLSNLLGAGFFAHASSRAYSTAGSFCRHLIDTAGVAALRRTYREGGTAAAFARHFGRPLSSLIADWKRWLATVAVPARELELARERHRRPSIFRRACPHAVARLAERAASLAGRRRFDETVPLRERICAFDPGDPGRLLELSQALEAAGQSDRAIASARRVLAHRATSKLLGRAAREQLGDLLWTRGAIDAARRAYAAAAAGPATAGRRRLLHLKRWALDAPPDRRSLLRRYLVDEADSRRDGARDVHLAHQLQRGLGVGASGLGLYLASKQLAGRGHWADAADAAREALARGLPTEDFVVEAHRVLGRCAYRQGRPFAARQAFERLRRRRGLASGRRLEAEDWLERIAWRLGERPPARDPQ